MPERIKAVIKGATNSFFPPMNCTLFPQYSVIKQYVLAHKLEKNYNNNLNNLIQFV